MSIYDRDETPVRVTFTLPRHMLDDLDEYAEAAKKSRAALLRSIIYSELQVVDLDDVRRFVNAPPSKYEDVRRAATRLNAEAKKVGYDGKIHK